jgi:hypothetical protein
LKRNLATDEAETAGLSASGSTRARFIWHGEQELPDAPAGGFGRLGEALIHRLHGGSWGCSPGCSQKKKKGGDGGTREREKVS